MESPHRESDRGAIVDPASRHGDPSPRAKEAQQLGPVSIFAPWATGDERALRVRMHKARDIATARSTNSRHLRARLIYSVVAGMASDWVFRPAEIGELERVLRALNQAFLAASNIEAVESPDEW